MVDLSEVLSTRDSCSEPDITSRPYLDIEVGAAEFHSLVDTGSTKTFLGSLNVTFNGVTHLMTIRILPGLNDSCVLGTDFLTRFGLVIDGKVRQLWLSEKLIIKFTFDPKFNDDLDACRGIALLSDTERD